jgi:hypothetical protein
VALLPETYDDSDKLFDGARSPAIPSETAPQSGEESANILSSPRGSFRTRQLLQADPASVLLEPVFTFMGGEPVSSAPSGFLLGIVAKAG